MNRCLLAASAFAAILAVSQTAQASQVAGFEFSGLGISSSGTFTIEPNVSQPDPNPACGTPGNNPCRHDPPGAFRITGVTGVFSDSNIGILNAAITGLVPINPENERDPVFDPLVPTSLSFVDSGLSYNNLYFPDGSPIDCDFPFLGTFLDVFGTAFTIAGGDTVNFWGDGNYLFGPLTYGVGVADGATVLDYQFSGISGSVPEPLTLSIFGAGLIGAFVARRRRKADKTA
jgi:hypothetical protein